MTMAVTKAVEGGREGDHLRIDRQYVRGGGGVRGARGHRLLRADPRRQDRAGQALAGDDARLGRDPDPRQLRRRHAPRAARGARACRCRTRELDQPVPAAGTENRRVRSGRSAGRCAGLPRAAGGQRRQHRRALDRATAKRRACKTKACAHCDGKCPFHREKIATRRPIMVGYQASGAAPIVRGKHGRESRDRRDRDSHRQSRLRGSSR